jgi:uncharacterized membrane protein
MSEEPDRGTTRMEAFSDAFFAIVITLLVLDLRPPELPHDAATYLLRANVIALWPNFAAFMISFVNIFIMWVSHHELMRITTRADTPFLYINGGLLFGIALVPFSTALAAEHALGPGALVAATLYTGTLLWIALFFNLLWRYVASHPQRLLPDVTRRDRLRISRTYAGTLGLYALALGLAFIAPLAAIGVTLALAVFFAVIDRLSGFASEDVANDAAGEKGSRN